MAVGDPDFRELLMQSPQVALREYNRGMDEESNPPCSLPRFEIELLSRVAGITGDFRQFCRLIIEERERLEEPKPVRVRVSVEERFETLTLRSA